MSRPTYFAPLLPMMVLVLLSSAARADLTDGEFTYRLGAEDGVFVASITGRTGTGGDVSIPEFVKNWPVRSIEEFAFAADGLRSVHVPAAITSIGAFAFAYCTNLSNVSLSSNVTNIGTGAFSGCSTLTNISIASGNVVFCSTNGVVFSRWMTDLVAFPGAFREYEVPSGVETIKEGAFYHCTSLVSVNLPASLRSIDSNGFEGCSSLTSLHVPYGTTNIGGRAFSGCSSLTNLSLPDSVCRLGPFLVQRCSGLTSVHMPTNLSSLAGVFQLSGLQNVVIPEGITNIDRAFTDSANLTSVRIPNSVTSIGAQAFYRCSGLTNIQFGTNVTVIGQDAFAGCLSLSEVILPASLTNMVEDTFGGCLSLKEIVIPARVTSMGYGVFYYATNLESVFFEGDAPCHLGSSIFEHAQKTTIYYLPDMMGWSNIFAGRPTAPWLPSMLSADMRSTGEIPHFAFDIRWATDRTVIVEASMDFVTWAPLSTNVLSNGHLSYTDFECTDFQNRFYRVCSP